MIFYHHYQPDESTRSYDFELKFDFSEFGRKVEMLIGCKLIGVTDKYNGQSFEKKIDEPEAKQIEIWFLGELTIWDEADIVEKAQAAIDADRA